jgi:uncharacterized protein (DUF983 family)
VSLDGARGQGPLFDGFLKLRSFCEECGLDHSFADPADGPAFFVLAFVCRSLLSDPSRKLSQTTPRALA